MKIPVAIAGRCEHPRRTKRNPWRGTFVPRGIRETAQTSPIKARFTVKPSLACGGLQTKQDGGRSALRNVAAAMMDCRQTSAQLTLNWESRQTQRHVSGCENARRQIRGQHEAQAIEVIEVDETGLGNRFEGGIHTGWIGCRLRAGKNGQRTDLNRPSQGWFRPLVFGGLGLCTSHRVGRTRSHTQPSWKEA